MPNTYTTLVFHIVFSTKDRRPFIVDALRPRIFHYLAGIVQEIGGRPFRINGTNDHVHLLVGFPPAVSICDAVRIIKTNSSRWVHRQGIPKGRFSWQTGYAAFTVSPEKLDGLGQYISTQESHHRRFSFRQEFLALLEQHGIDFSERYLWD